MRRLCADTEGGDNLGNHLVAATERKNAGHAPVRGKYAAEATEALVLYNSSWTARTRVRGVNSRIK